MEMKYFSFWWLLKNWKSRHWGRIHGDCNEEEEEGGSLLYEKGFLSAGYDEGSSNG